MPDQINDSTPDEEEDEDIAICSFCDDECDGDNDRVTIIHGSRRLDGVQYRRGYTEEDRTVCEDCRVTCNDCHTEVHADAVNSDSQDNAVCPNCWDNYTECEECGDMIHQDDSRYHDGNECSYCNNCYETMEVEDRIVTGRYIHNYSHKPDARLHSVDSDGDIFVTHVWNAPKSHEHELFMGFELETNRKDRDKRYDLNAIAKWLIDNSPEDYLYNKEDCSISGFEIVTHPCTLEAHKRLLPRDAIRGLGTEHAMKSWQGSGAGFHVHLSKSAFEMPSHKYKLQLFHHRNMEVLKRFAGRDSDYASFSNYSGRKALTIAKDKSGRAYQDYRNSALNFMNEHTIELRYFRGTLRPESVLGVLEFCHSVHKFTQEVTSKEANKNGLSWASYKEFMVTQGYEFLPELCELRAV